MRWKMREEIRTRSFWSASSFIVGRNSISWTFVRWIIERITRAFWRSFSCSWTCWSRSSTVLIVSCFKLHRQETIEEGRSPIDYLCISRRVSSCFFSSKRMICGSHFLSPKVEINSVTSDKCEVSKSMSLMKLCRMNRDSSDLVQEGDFTFISTDRLARSTLP